VRKPPKFILASLVTVTVGVVGLDPALAFGDGPFTAVSSASLTAVVPSPTSSTTVIHHRVPPTRRAPTRPVRHPAPARHLVAEAPATTVPHHVIVPATVPPAPPVTHPVVTVPPPPPPPPPPPTTVPAPRPTTPPPLPNGDPTRSIPPPPGMNADCIGSGSIAQCNAVALSAIDAARQSEGLGPLWLPAGFASLSAPSQLVAVTDAERTSRGLPALAANSVLDQLAGLGASLNQDPTGPAGYTWGSNIAWGYDTALATDYLWMYNDGPGGNNVMCPPGGGGGCWGHRHNILAPWGGAMGAGVVDAGGSWRFAILLVDGF
jgi:hypothetical protein